jgi:hypothetical protein
MSRCRWGAGESLTGGGKLLANAWGKSMGYMGQHKPKTMVYPKKVVNMSEDMG